MSATVAVPFAPTLRVDARRSMRLSLSIPVELTAEEAGGELLEECTRTMFLSKHGASLRTRRLYRSGIELEVRMPHLELAGKARVVWSVPDRSDGLGYETAIEMEGAESFWGVKFPAEGWAAPQ